MNETLAKWITESERIVFFGGAGVSTESGIPDFRSVDGLYNQQYQYPPETILSHTFFLRRPEEFYRFYRNKMLFPDALPNAAHEKLAQWEREGRLTGVVTQNIDGLHKRAGNRLGYEVHGSVWENYCMDCNAFYGVEKMLNSDGIPRCERCGGVIKPWVVLYGEAPDKYTCMGACREISGCDALIVAGTSLSVEPAASFLEYFHGKNLVVINEEPTSADVRADLVIRGDVAAVMDGVTVEGK